MIHTRLAVTPSDPARREAVSAALFSAGAEGLIEEGAALVTVFAQESSAIAAEQAARAADDRATLVREAIDPGDWNEVWRAGVRPHQVGRLLIAPPWHSVPGADTIVIDPGLGFGTGEHETTRGVLRLLQNVVTEGDVVADVGCGSGVLAIAAARLGASRVAAIDNDPQAIRNAEENVARNGVGGCVTVVEGDATVLLPLLAPVRVVAANIIASVLLEMLPSLDAALAPGGDLVVGGILTTERDAFTMGVGRRGWSVVVQFHDGEWWSAQLRRTNE